VDVLPINRWYYYYFIKKSQPRSHDLIPTLAHSHYRLILILIKLKPLLSSSISQLETGGKRFKTSYRLYPLSCQKINSIYVYRPTPKTHLRPSYLAFGSICKVYKKKKFGLKLYKVLDFTVFINM
jgi:hypothetical protein